MSNHNRLLGMIESFLFIAGDEGLSLKQLMALTMTDEHSVTEALRHLRELYEKEIHRGITLKQFGGAYRLVTKAEFAEEIKRLLENPSPQTVTKASLEVLAIIAYKQPVTRVEIDDLRGVKSEGPLHTLVSRGFVMEQGRSEGSGRAILYGTTDLFLDKFGLKSLKDLPPLILEEDTDQEDNDLFMTHFQEAFSFDEEGGNAT